MSTPEKISPDDPRLTTYALGEMEPVEQAEFERLLKHDAAGRAFVAEINRTAHSIGVALASEEVPQTMEVGVGQAAIIPGRNLGKFDGGPLPAGEVPNLRRGLAKLFQFPQMYYTISGLAAACFAIGFVLWQAGYHPQTQVQYVEVDLTKLAPANAAKAKNPADAPTELAVSLQPALAGGDEGVVSLEQDGKDNAFLAVKSEPLSTFPIKTDIAAYVQVRHLIEGGRRPPREAVRIEELVNAFPYHYAPPGNVADAGGGREGTSPTKNGAQPFAAHLEVASAPWAPEHRLVRIGLKGREVQKQPVGGALATIAKDVKIQVEFNPAQVQSYRLIGYENRRLHPEAVSDEKIDAGEIVAGHTVTALYEIVLTGAEIPRDAGAGVALETKPQADAAADEKHPDLLTLTVRYQPPDSDVSSKLEFPLRDGGRSFDLASADFKFAASVAAFGMILRDSPHKGVATLAHVTEWAQAGLGNDTGGYRTEFLGLVGQTERLSHN